MPAATKLLVILLWLTPCALPCSCPYKPACASIGADAIFLGRVSFNNDDGSGTFIQSTLVRFDVEERFKGIAPEVQQVWVDPGSFTTCYEEYTLGRLYLIFASKSESKSRFRTESAAVTVVTGGNRTSKPLPPGIDPAHPPAIYSAPECMGSRPADFPHLEEDLMLLRAYLNDLTLPRILGHVSLHPYYGWPIFSGPILSNAEVAVSSDRLTLHAVTDDRGNFSLPAAPEGYYKVTAHLEPFPETESESLYVPPVGCGYANVQLYSPSTLQGIVLDHLGHPAPDISVIASVKETDSQVLRATTDKRGRFALRGLPDADFVLSGGESSPRTDSPYRRSFYPAAIRLKLGEHRDGLVLRLGAPLAKGSKKVRVIQKGGGRKEYFDIKAIDELGSLVEFEHANANGLATIPCLRDFKYVLEAQARPQVQQWRIPLLKSSRASFTCGEPGMPLQLIVEPSTR